MAGITDRGRIRADNEDAIVFRPDCGFAVLADGMGGHQAGEIASRIAVDTIARCFEEAGAADESLPISVPETEVVRESIERANAAIYREAQTQPDRHGMGSTVVVAAFHGDHVSIGHVGDSRFYRLRAGRLEQLTRDHSVVQELVNRNLYTLEEARQSVSRNLVTRALGIDPEVTPDLSEQPCTEGDLYLLCSDGLSEVLSDAEIGEIMSAPDRDLAGAARRLIDCANERGGPDNISAILARCTSD